MGALDSNALLLESGNVYIGDDVSSLVDFGAVRNVNFTGVQNPIDILSDNRGSVVRKNRINGQINFDWLEAGDANKLENLLKGLVTKTATAGSLVSGATYAIANPSGYATFLDIEGQNGAGTAQTINSVTGSVDGALLTTDYIQVKDSQGRWGIQLVSGGTITTLTQTFTVNYDYTPNASLKITGGTSKVSTARYVRIIGTSADDPTKTRVIELQSAVIESDVLLPFLDTEVAGDVGVFPITMTNDKGSTWSFEDSINPA